MPIGERAVGMAATNTSREARPQLAIEPDDMHACSSLPRANRSAAII